MKNLINIARKILIPGGGWFPLLVFISHLFLIRFPHLYGHWPHIDIPVHFFGGLSIAFFISHCFQLLSWELMKRSRVVVLELLLIGSLTTSVAVFWEFAEFILDLILGMNVQVSLANTMIDLAMGVLGALTIMLIRYRQLHAGIRELREVTSDWVSGVVA